MAMTKCGECGHAISTRAKACPSCGAVPKARTSLVTWIVAIFFGLPMLFAVIVTASKSGEAPPAKVDKAPTQEDIAMQRAVAGARLLKKAMRDPDSFKLESAFVINGSHAVCYGYRARNGFGGMNRDHAVLARDGTRFLTSGDPGFEKLWNAECANKPGREVATAINWFAL